MDSNTRRPQETVEVGVIPTEEGRALHVFARPGSDRPFVLGVSGDRRHQPFTVALTAVELEHFLTLLEQAGRAR